MRRSWRASQDMVVQCSRLIEPLHLDALDAVNRAEIPRVFGVVRRALRMGGPKAASVALGEKVGSKVDGCK